MQGASEWLESESAQELKKKAADSLTEALGNEVTEKLSDAIGGVGFSASSLQALSETEVIALRCERIAASNSDSMASFGGRCWMKSSRMFSAKPARFLLLDILADTVPTLFFVLNRYGTSSVKTTRLAPSQPRWSRT